MRGRIRKTALLTAAGAAASWVTTVLPLLLRATPPRARAFAPPSPYRPPPASSARPPSARSPLFRPLFRTTPSPPMSAASSSSRRRRQPSSPRGGAPSSVRNRRSTPLAAVPAPDSGADGPTATTAVDAPNGGSGAGAAAGEEELVARLRRENRSLQERLRRLEVRNERLEREQRQRQRRQPQPRARAPDDRKRLVLEDFEGEGGAVDGWNRRERRYDAAPWDNYVPPPSQFMERGGSYDYDEDDDELGLSPPAASTLSEAEDEVCEYDESSGSWECPMEPNVAFGDAVKSRAAWLVGLLAMQSCSGFILARNELLLQDHPVIVYFLTMLVGAGGNAGNQASVRVIRGLALGTLNPRTQMRFLSRELRMAFALSAILSAAGFVRAVAFRTPLPETLAVTSALSMIVFSSICLGAVLPLLLQKLGVDPAHSSTTIQVVMDILGVVLTVFVSTLVLDSGWGKMLIHGLSSWLGL